MKTKKSLQEKVKAEFPEFYEECQSLNVDALNGRLAQAAKDAQSTEEAKEADEEYQAAKQAASDMGSPYRDAKKAIKLRSKFIIATIKDRGGK